jgi:hypothetical protein
VKRKRLPVPAASSNATGEVSVPKPASPEALIPEALIEDTRKMLEAGRVEKLKPCIVCGEPCAPTSTEGLCWVCRRLKLSAWRDSDTQMPAQE